MKQKCVCASGTKCLLCAAQSCLPYFTCSPMYQKFFSLTVEEHKDNVSSCCHPLGHALSLELKLK